MYILQQKYHLHCFKSSMSCFVKVQFVHPYKDIVMAIIICNFNSIFLLHVLNVYETVVHVQCSAQGVRHLCDIVVLVICSKKCCINWCPCINHYTFLNIVM